MPKIIQDNWIPALIATVLGLLTGATGTQLVDTRPDPFTGSDAKTLQAEMRLWTIDYVQRNVPPKHMLLRMRNVESEIDDLHEKIDHLTDLVREHMTSKRKSDALQKEAMPRHLRAGE